MSADTTPDPEVGDESDRLPDPASGLLRGRRAVAVVDVVESVRLMQANEADTVARWSGFAKGVGLELVPACGGRLVKSLGDGMLLEFTEVSQALAAARAVQRRVAPLNAGRRPEEQMQLRVGLHVCEVAFDGLDIYGSGVNLTARLAGLAGPGQIVMSEAFHAEALGVDPLDDVEDLGLCYLKHLDEPVRALRTLRADAPGPRQAMAARAPAPVPQAGMPAAHDGPADAGGPTVAVLSFEPAAPGADDRVVADLLVDALVARLAVCPGLRVISSWSARAVDPAAVTGALAWSRLRAHYVVRGRVHRLGGQTMVGLELLDTADDGLAWAGRQAFQVADLLQPDDDFSLGLAAELARQIASAQLRRARTSALPTLDGNLLQFSASSLMHQPDADAVARSHAMLDHLIERYPRLPSPRAWAAMWCVLQVTRGFEHDPARIAGRALDHVARALDNDSECALAMAMGGFVQCHLRRDLAAADALLARAVALNPNESWAWLFRSVVASHRGEGENAWNWASRACALSPLDPLRHYFDGLRSNAALVAERWDDAVRLAQRSLAVNGAHLPTLRGLAIAQVALGQLDDARRTGLRILAADPGFNLRDYLASAPADGAATRRRYVALLGEAGLPQQ